MATIGTLGILSGIAIFWRPQPGGIIDPNLTLALTRGIGPLPYGFVALAILAVLLDIWLHRSRSGLATRAVGLSPVPSQRIGLRVSLIRSVALVLAASGATVGGLFEAGQVGIGSNDVALGFSLPIFAACFLGGAALSGGRGTFVGGALGVLLLTMVSNAALLIGMTNAVSQIIYGSVLLVAITIYAVAARLKATT